MMKKVKGPVSKKDEGLWAYIEKKKTDGMQARRPFEQKWLLNLAFLAGRQYVFFNSSAHVVQNLQPVPGRIRMMDNQLLPKVRRQIADFVKASPIMSVVPSTTEDEDIQAAKAGDKFLKSFWQKKMMKKRVRQLAGWLYSTGNCFLDHRWNRRIGPTELDEDTGELVYAGDVDIGVWSPFEIIVPFTAMGNVDLHSFDWIMKIKWRALDYIRDNYEKGDLVKEEALNSSVISTAFLLGGAQGTQTRKFPGAYLVEFYKKPGKDFPRGLFVAGANGIILNRQDYPFTRYNIEQFKDIDIPGHFWGKATMEDGIPLQKTWNTTLSDIQEFNRTMGRGKFLIPERSGMRIEFDNVTGQHIYYKPVMGLKPELLTMKNVPTSFIQTLDVTYQSLNNLFSQHEVTQGTNKSDIRSGEMVALLREQDAFGAIPAHAIFEESLESLMSGVLKRVQKGYTKPRMIEITGRDKEIEVISFSATDLRDNTNVSVKKQSSLPDSRMAREQRVLGRFERGLYGDPRDPEVRRHVMNMLEDAVVKDIYAGDRRDEAVARWENRIIAYVKIGVNNYDNHAIHLQEHTSFQKSLDYQRLKVEQPKMFIELEANFLAHNMQHQKYLAEQRAAMIEEQIKLNSKGGKSGGKGGGQKRVA